ncbi:right-handed parallel beta-helix repeat-containing protein [Corticibacterium sp. UT-5YL-CI-8]|nr:right-handed parallel beta-helix repeat-containing protein [Tianweitania sp. UT-5YL-CI-8]
MELRNYRSTDIEFLPIGILVQGAGNRIEIRNNIIHNIEANFAPVGTKRPGALGMALNGTSSTLLRNLVVDGNELYDLQTGNGEALTVTQNAQYFQITKNIVRDSNFIGIDAQGYFPDNIKYRSRNGWIASNTVYNLSTAGNLASPPDAAAIGIYVDGGSDITVERSNVYNTEGGIFLLSEWPGRYANKNAQHSPSTSTACRPWRNGKP